MVAHAATARARLFAIALLFGFAIFGFGLTALSANPGLTIHACAAAFPTWDGTLFNAPGIVWSLILGDLEIAGWYFLISSALVLYALSDNCPWPDLVLSFAAFIFLCGMTHVVKVCVLFKPLYGLESLVIHACSTTSLASFLILVLRYRGMLDHDTAAARIRVLAARDIPELRLRMKELEASIARSADA